MRIGSWISSGEAASLESCGAWPAQNPHGNHSHCDLQKVFPRGPQPQLIWRQGRPRGGLLGFLGGAIGQGRGPPYQSKAEKKNGAILQCCTILLHVTSVVRPPPEPVVFVCLLPLLVPISAPLTKIPCMSTCSCKVTSAGRNRRDTNDMRGS